MRKQLTKNKLLLGAVFGLLILIFVIAGRSLLTSPEKTSQNNKVQLKTAVIQNLILLDSVYLVNVSTPTSGEEHQVIKQKLDENLKQLEALSGVDDKTIADQLKATIDQERQWLDAYATRLDLFKKALAYNPSDDLGNVAVDRDANELLQRVSSAEQGLDAILQRISFTSNTGGRTATQPNPIQVSKETGVAFSGSKDCLSNLKSLLTSGNLPGSVSKRPQCIAEYADTRRSLNKEATVAFDTEVAQNTKSQLRSLAERL